ncbi:MAG: hypothetical protein K9M81_00810 [Chthoniobacterales bacterium]|nr:hypothetical protein [Chthoniobacterales bacterium]
MVSNCDFGIRDTYIPTLQSSAHLLLISFARRIMTLQCEIFEFIINKKTVIKILSVKLLLSIMEASRIEFFLKIVHFKLISVLTDNDACDSSNRS